MNRRVSKSLVALSFAVVLCLSTPSAFASGRGESGFEPSFTTRIVRFIAGIVHHFTPSTNTDFPSVPKP
ncbi:MAG: hypothetical protein NVSMB68_01160 [Thermoanaerobaculia bacterium]